MSSSQPPLLLSRQPRASLRPPHAEVEVFGLVEFAHPELHGAAQLALLRRMIWRFDGTPALPTAEGLRDVDGEPLDTAAIEFVTLWHPVQSSSEIAAGWQARLGKLGIVQPVEQATRDVVDVGRFLFLCDEIDWLDQTRMRAFLRTRGWKVPWLGPFDHTPFAQRQLFPGGPTALLWLAYREEDGRVRPAALTFESAAHEEIRASSMQHAPWLSEIGRDVLGAATAGRP